MNRLIVPEIVSSLLVATDSTIRTIGAAGLRMAVGLALRFAIDFVRLYEDGPTIGDPAENRNWRSYGAEAIAVADARVESVKDGIRDNVPANRAPSGMTLDTMGGNTVHLATKERREPTRSRCKTGSSVFGNATQGIGRRR